MIRKKRGNFQLREKLRKSSPLLTSSSVITDLNKKAINDLHLWCVLLNDPSRFAHSAHKQSAEHSY